MHCVDTSPKVGYKTDANFLRVVTCSKIFALAEETLSLCSAVKRVCRHTKKLLLAVNSARIPFKNAALLFWFRAVNRLIFKVPYRMCIDKDAIHFVFSAMSVG